MDSKKALSKAIQELLGDDSASDLARRSGLSPSAVSDYLNEKRYPRKKNLSKLAKGLACEPEQLSDLVWKIRKGEYVFRNLPNDADEGSRLLSRILLNSEKFGLDEDADAELKGILEEVSASSYHALKAQDLLNSAMTRLVRFLADHPSLAATG